MARSPAKVATVLETRKAVGDQMDLMIDPACEYETWADALKLHGRDRNTNYNELGLVHPNVRGRAAQAPVLTNGYSDDLDAVHDEGCVPVPRGSGLGFAIDHDWVKAHEAGAVTYD